MLASTASTNTYINNYSYIKYAIYPKNVNGTCGYVGASLVLNYWNKTNPSKNLIPSTYLDSNGNLETSGYTLQDKLLSYGYGDATWGKNIRDALIDFCNEVGVAATSNYYIGKIGAVSELNDNRPVTIISYFIVHYGWSGYEEVVLDGGLIGSNTEFKLN